MSGRIWAKLIGARRLLILIALSVVLGAIIAGFMILKNRPKEAAEEPQEKIAISRFDEKLLQKITLKTADHTLILFKDGRQWKAESEVPVELDETAVQDLVYSFTSLYSEALVEEKPKDLAQYGFDPPKATATATLTDGSVREFYLGDQTPVKTTYYLKAKDDPRVFAVWMNHASHFRYTLSDIRNKKLPEINTQELVYLKIWKEGKPVFEVMSEELLPGMEEKVEFALARLYVTIPYHDPKPIASNRWSEDFISKFHPPRIKKFVDDRPKDLFPYGLDPPKAELLMKDKENTLHLLLGEKEGDVVYFQQKGRPAVHALDADILTFLDVKPFVVIDKFAFIVNIDHVNWVRITGRGQDRTLSIKRKEIEKTATEEEQEVKESYFLDGKEVEEKPFKAMYQSIIGLLIDAEYSPPIREKPEIRITYNLNEGERREHRITFVPYNVDFYAVFKNGLSEFLINRAQLDNVFSDLDALTKGELKGN
jgi:hypothetical protein